MPDDHSIRNTLKTTSRLKNAVNESANEIEVQLVRFHTGDHTIDFNIDLTGETIWATRQQIADLYGIDRTVVSKHIKNLYDSGEFEAEATCAKFAHVQSEGSRDVKRNRDHYDLDVILAVGFRVRSPRAREFRRWAYRILRNYITEGYALNEARLRDDPEALRSLAEEVRALREEEKSYFHMAKEVFRRGACDYDPKSPITREFYARLQNTFHFAITHMTAAEIKLERARFQLPNMGMKHGMPAKDAAQVAKNYLEPHELRRYRILSEQFTLFVEERAARGEKTTMQQLLDQFNRLLEAGDYPILPPGPDRRAKKAEKHTQAQYAMWLMRNNKPIADKRP